jgi:transcriptional regulator with XRE-family HTH domain
MPRAVPPPLSLALAFLRVGCGWTQQELARAAGTSPQMISDYETGQRKTLGRETLDELAAAMGYVPEDATLALLFQAGALSGEDERRRAPWDPSPSQARRARRLAARAGLTEACRLRSQLLELARGRRVDQDRRRAARQWDALRRLPPDRQRQLIEASPEPHSWTLVERLCAESVRAAADLATRALHLARLALRVAELVPEDGAWRSRLLGYAWAFVANAQRVGSDLPAAEASFATAWRLWRAGGAAEGGPLQEWRLHDLEASLRRDQRRFQAALECSDRALASAPPAARARILLKRELIQEVAGEIEAALATLQEAAPLVDADGEPRNRRVVRFNAIVLLCHLGRYQDAAARLPELRRLAVEQGAGRLDLVRVLWLSARVAAGLGQRPEATAMFEQVLQELAEHRNAYDAALAGLELAVLHLEAGRAGEVAGLAGGMVWIFGAQGVHREALAAVRLFCQAARNGSANARLARRVLDYLERARRDPMLRFEDGVGEDEESSACSRRPRT